MMEQSYLAHHCTANTPGLLFPNRKRTRTRPRDNLVKYGIHRAMKSLGMPIKKRTGLQAWRHDLATELADASVPLPVLQCQVRHDDIRTTMNIYTHLVSDTHKNAIETFPPGSRWNICS